MVNPVLSRALKTSLRSRLLGLISSTPSKPASFKSWKLASGEPLLTPPSMNAFFQGFLEGSSAAAIVGRVSPAVARAVPVALRKVLRSIDFMVELSPGLARG